MAPTTKLKFRGNKAFSMLSTIESEADLSKTWRLMTKVKDSLEYGKRLENLSWRLWFMHHLMVHDQKTQTKFRKLSTATTKKLETEKTTELNKLPPLPSYRPKVPADPADKKGKKKSTPKKKIFTSKNNTNANDGSVASSSRPNDSTSLVATISTNNDAMNIDYKTEDNSVSTLDINGDLMLDTSVAMVDGSMGSNDAAGDLSPVSNATISQHDEDVAAVINVSANDESDVPHADLPGYYQLNVNELRELNMSGEEFVLHQFTPDQDPTQVVRLSPMNDFEPIFIPTYRPPSLGITFSQMVRLGSFYPDESPESSEPTSPTEWYVGQQPSPGIQQHLPYGDQLVTHDAVYVPNRSSPTNSNPSNNLIPSINQTSDLPGTNMIRNSGLIYQYDSSPGNVAVATSTDSQTGNTPSSNAPSSISQSSGNRQPSSTPEGRPKKAHSSGEQQCFNCGVTSTPLWRRSANDELLCNACGLYLKLHKMARPKTMKPHIVRKDARDDETTQPVCSNCGTMNTPLWRRDEEGQTLCNACGLYFKLHHEKRPLSMKTDVIKKRQRYENGQNPNRRTSKKQRSTDTDNPQDQQQQYGQISVSPTTTSMTIPASIAVQPGSTPAMNVPTSLNSLNIVEQDLNSPISIPPPTSPMTTPAPNRSLHGVGFS